jgi:hypothetical protein
MEDYHCNPNSLSVREQKRPQMLADEQQER